MKHYLEESSVVLSELQTGADGLSQQEAAERLEKNGRLYYGMGCLSGLLIVVTLL